MNEAAAFWSLVMIDRASSGLMSRYRAPQALDADCGALRTMMEMC